MAAEINLNKLENNTNMIQNNFMTVTHEKGKAMLIQKYDYDSSSIANTKINDYIL